jgi:hypothetical protein
MTDEITLDPAASAWPRFNVSAEKLGVSLRLSPNDLRHLLHQDSPVMLNIFASSPLKHAGTRLTLGCSSPSVILNAVVVVSRDCAHSLIFH